MREDFIAYEGPEYTIEWYFDDRGKSKVQEYYEDLSPERKKKIMNLFKLLANIGEICNEEKFRNEGDQIYAFKPLPDRFFCFFFDDSKVIVTNAYEKKTMKLSPREKEKALKVKDEYIKRCKAGRYYD